MDNELPACIFEVIEMGNKEFSWSGLIVEKLLAKPSCAHFR